MPRHWKKFMDKELIGAHDLDGRDVTVVIVDVDGGEISNGNKKNKKPIAKLASREGRPLEKKLALNATNCRVLEQLSGSPDVDKWRGLPIVLFGTTTQFGGQTVDCVRIRPYPPKDGKARNGNSRNGAAREPLAAPSDDLPPDDAAAARAEADAKGHARKFTAEEMADARAVIAEDDVPQADGVGGADA